MIFKVGKEFDWKSRIFKFSPFESLIVKNSLRKQRSILCYSLANDVPARLSIIKGFLQVKLNLCLWTDSRAVKVSEVESVLIEILGGDTENGLARIIHTFF